MANYYIATTSGSDVTGDGSQGNPWQTVDHAIDNTIGGDFIYFDEAGSYPVTDNKDWSGRSYIASPSTYTLDGIIPFYKTLPVVIDMSNMTTNVREGIIINTDVSNNTFFQMLHFKNHPDNSLLGAGNFQERKALFYRSGNGTSIFNACKFTDLFITHQFQIGGLIGGADSDLFNDNIILIGCEIRDLKCYSTVTGFQQIIGRHTEDVAEFQLRIENCTIITDEPNNKIKWILDTGGTGRNYWWKNNIVVNEQTTQLEIVTGIDPTSNINTSNNIYWDKNGSIAKSLFQSSDDIDNNPYFYDFTNKDFRLYPGSAGVNNRDKLEI